MYSAYFYSSSDLLKILVLYLYIAKDSLHSQISQSLLRNLAHGLFVELEFLASLSLALFVQS